MGLTQSHPSKNEAPPELPDALRQVYQLICCEQPPALTEENVIDLLADYLNRLIATDFNRLVSLLYRVDVSEERVRAELAHYGQEQPAGQMIAKLMIDRQQQKAAFRDRYKNGLTPLLSIIKSN